MARHRRASLSARQVGRRRGKAEDLPVKRWLQLGAASAGMGAALFGFSLVSPGSGVAAADTGSEASASSSSTESDASAAPERSARSAESADAEDKSDDAAASDDDDSESEADAEDPDTEDPDADVADAAVTVEDEADVDKDAGDPDDSNDTAAADAEAAAQTGAPSDEEPVEEVKLVQALPDTENNITATASDEQDSADIPEEESLERPWDEVVAQFLDDWAMNTEAWIDTLAVSDQRKLRMEESFYAMRRAFFNQAPTVDPVQITGVITGPITGAVYAQDADDDRIVYRIVEGPKTGSLRFHADGTYTYTPGVDFNGVDTFTVIAIDAGLHINLLNLFRPLGTQATSLINQGAIKFDFNFTNDPEREIWTSGRVAALQQAADQLVRYVRVLKPVTLRYDVEGSDDPESDTLASAWAELLPETTGFVYTRLQHEIITGENTNGTGADGFINVNFGHNWSLGPEVGPDQSDFVGVLMHELLHSWGWADYEDAGVRRAIYSSFLMTRNRDRVFNDDTSWNPEYDPNELGQNGGLYFGGANAVAEYGGLVPIFTPAIFEPGSSIHHLDDVTFVGDDFKLMDAYRPLGVKWWTVSDLELAILKDLGYTVAPLPGRLKLEPALRDPIDFWTADTIEWIDELDVSAQAKLSLEQSFFAMRRALFNRAPSVDPVQLTGVIAGAVTGDLGAADVDNDRIVYRIVEGPKAGSLRLHTDGSYTYTPGADFNGVDTFTVMAVDTGLHVNLADLFRPLGTRATPLINQGAIKFDFSYNVGEDYWTPEFKDALQNAADELAAYFRVEDPVVLTYDVSAMNDPATVLLAEAGGEMLSTESGFWPTRLHYEIVTGYDSNGAAPDGIIRVNFAKKWGLGDSIGADEYDFTAMLMHELLHSWGFNFGGDNLQNWQTYAQFVVTEDEESWWNPDFTFNGEYDPNLIGQNGGFYFGGANAVAAYGGLVPLYTPDPIAAGSTLSHLDGFTFTGANRKLMNPSTDTGPGIRMLSPLELAILMDLGYTVMSP